jgi:hypothetical protein
MEMQESPAQPAKEGRVRRGWRLTRLAWDLIRRDRTMIALALMGALFACIASLAVLYFGGYFDHPGSTGRLALVGLIAIYPSTFASVFFNVALTSAAAASLDGRELTLREALDASIQRIGKIAVWSLIAAGVGAVLNQIASRVPGGGKLLTLLAGAAWSLATIFVIPILVVEDIAPLPSLKRSASLFRERWGESVAGRLTIDAWMVVLGIPAGILFGLGISVVDTSPATGATMLTVAALVFVAMFAIGAALNQVFSLALYRYATGGPAEVFPEADLGQPFTRTTDKSRDGETSDGKAI